MSQYAELVKALRCCAENFGCPIECPRYSPADEGVRACVSRLEKDAADAIEDMAKHITEMHERVTVLQIARGELEAEVKRLKPKRGEWIKHPEVKNIYGGVYIECPFCGEKYVVQNVSDEKFCRNCGADMRAKMEAQE